MATTSEFNSALTAAIFYGPRYWRSGRLGRSFDDHNENRNRLSRLQKNFWNDSDDRGDRDDYMRTSLYCAFCGQSSPIQLFDELIEIGLSSCTCRDDYNWLYRYNLSWCFIGGKSRRPWTNLCYLWLLQNNGAFIRWQVYWTNLQLTYC